MTNPPTKAEVLLTKGCNLKCKYCALRRYTPNRSDSWKQYNELSDEQWSEVPSKLVELGVSFAPIYGAEPLTRLPALLNFVSSCSKVGLKNTVITNATLLNKDAIKQLKVAGLSSITLSNDIKTKDSSVGYKSISASSILSLCLEEFEDVEVITTITKENLKLVPSFISSLPKEVWFHFDFMHHDRKQPGTKCTGKHRAFSEEDKPDILNFLSSIQNLKKSGTRIHPSDECLQFLSDNIDLVINTNWKCELGSFVTIDSSFGSVQGCDDFCPTDLQGKFSILKYNVDWRWTQWLETWRPRISECPGCIWLTHVMSTQWWNKEKGESWKKQITHCA